MSKTVLALTTSAFLLSACSGGGPESSLRPSQTTTLERLNQGLLSKGCQVIPASQVNEANFQDMLSAGIENCEPLSSSFGGLTSELTEAEAHEDGIYMLNTIVQEGRGVFVYAGLDIYDFAQLSLNALESGNDENVVLDVNGLQVNYLTDTILIPGKNGRAMLSWEPFGLKGITLGITGDYERDRALFIKESLCHVANMKYLVLDDSNELFAAIKHLGTDSLKQQEISIEMAKVVDGLAVICLGDRETQAGTEGGTSIGGEILKTFGIDRNNFTLAQAIPAIDTLSRDSLISAGGIPIIMSAYQSKAK